MFKQSTIDRIRESLDIVALVGETVKLKQFGHNHKGLCPLHKDKNTLSLSVDPKKQLWHCFGCQKGGNAFTWIQETEGVRFDKAVELAGERVGIDARRSRTRVSGATYWAARNAAADSAYYWRKIERIYICQMLLVNKCLLQAERWGRCNIEGEHNSTWDHVWMWSMLAPKLMLAIGSSLATIRSSAGAHLVQAYKELPRRTRERIHSERLLADSLGDRLVALTGEPND